MLDGMIIGAIVGGKEKYVINGPANAVSDNVDANEMNK